MFFENGGMCMKYKFDLTNDYQKEVFDLILHLIYEERRLKREGKPTHTTDERIAITEDIIDCYIAQTGKRPSPAAIYRMGDYILHEDITDKTKIKARLQEYNVLTRTQLNSRKKRERFNQQYLEEGIANTHKDQRHKGRRERSLYEKMYVDGDLKHLKPIDKIPYKY